MALSSKINKSHLRIIGSAASFHLELNQDVIFIHDLVGEIIGGVVMGERCGEFVEKT